MHLLYSLFALDLASERVREAEHDRLVALARAGLTDRPSIVRRGLAHGLAAVSRITVSAIRWLDECVADDLSRSLSATAE